MKIPPGERQVECGAKMEEFPRGKEDIVESQMARRTAVSEDEPFLSKEGRRQANVGEAWRTTEEKTGNDKAAV